MWLATLEAIDVRNQLSGTADLSQRSSFDPKSVYHPYTQMRDEAIQAVAACSTWSQKTA